MHTLSLPPPGCCSGRKRVDFANGTRKDSHPDGRLTIRFANGDVKMQQASGQVDYFYSEVMICIRPSGDRKIGTIMSPPSVGWW